MSKFCKYCGAEMQDTEAFCGKCGAKSESKTEPVATPVVENSAVVATSANENGEAAVVPVKKNNTKLYCIIAGAVVLVGILAFLLLGGGGPESAFENMIDYQNGNIEALRDLAPEQYWEYYEAKNGKSIDALIAEKQSEWDSAMAQYQNMGVDLDIDYDYSISNEIDFTEQQIISINKYLTQQFGFNENSASGGCQAQVELTIKQNGMESTNSDTGVFLEIDGDWYMAEIDFDDDEVDDIEFVDF